MGSNRKGKGLTVKQNLFVCEYCSNGGNASAAARVAGYSAKTAPWIGNENLQKPQIKAAIDARGDSLTSRMGQYDITEERILREMALMAFVNLDDFYDEEGNMKPVHKLTRDQCAAITEVTEKSYGKGGDVFEQKYKLADKKSMLDMLAKYKKLYNQDDENLNSNEKDVRVTIVLPSNGR